LQQRAIMPAFHPPEWVSQPCRVATLEVGAARTLASRGPARATLATHTRHAEEGPPTLLLLLLLLAACVQVQLPDGAVHTQPVDKQAYYLFGRWGGARGFNIQQLTCRAPRPTASTSSSA
jgi:hypothetical protein